MWHYKLCVFTDIYGDKSQLFSRVQKRNTPSVHHLQKLPIPISIKLLVYPSPSIGPHYRPHRISLLLLCLNFVLIILFQSLNPL